jgi:hypothetical protein
MNLMKIISLARDWLALHSVRSHIVAPIWLRIPEKHRWTIAHWLNRSRRTCWADLVDDALARPESDPCDVHIPSLPGVRKPRCASVCWWSHPEHTGEHDCSCYCNKFQFTATDGARDRDKEARV